MKITVRARNGVQEFECPSGEKILRAGLCRGIGLSYECATGTCGVCKARLLSGHAESEWSDAPGRRYLKGSGELLTCQSVAHRDCTLEVEAVQPAELIAPWPSTLDGVLRDARQLTHDVIAFDVELSKPLDFEAGQFALISVPGIVGARAYSMANFQRAARRLSFLVKKRTGGAVSEWLFGGGVEGTRLALFAPLGHAIFHPGVSKHLLCIAGGQRHRGHGIDTPAGGPGWPLHNLERPPLFRSPLGT